MIREIFLEDMSLWIWVWQSTLFTIIGLSGSFLLRCRPARAFQMLFLAMIAAVLLPAMSILVKHFDLGMFTKETIAIRQETPSNAITSDYDTSVTGPTIDIQNEVRKEAGELTLSRDDSRRANIPWRMVVLYVWMTATLTLAGRLLVAFVGGIFLLRRAQFNSCEQILRAADFVRAKLGIAKDMQIRSSRDVHSPVIWCWSPALILLVPGDSAHRVDWVGVICHELAHWSRKDHISGLIAELIICILPWNPLLWWAKKRMIRLSEQACDDWVLAGGQPCEDYAQSLLNFRPQKQVAFVPAVVSSRKTLAGRVRRILKDSCSNPRTGVVWALTASLITLCLSVGIAFAQTRHSKPTVTVIPTTFALTARKETERSAEFLLDRMLEYRSKVRNLQYVAEENIREDLAARKAAVEDLISEMRAKGTPERQLERLRETMSRLSESRYQILECTIDDAERVKIELTRGTYDSAGKKVPSPDKRIWAWNGVSATDFSQRTGSLGEATIRDTPLVVTKLGHPWRTFTGTLCLFLEKTITAGTRVSVDELKDGTYRIAFEYKTSRIVAVIDPSKGYTCTLHEDYYNGQLTRRYTPIYEEVAEDIWFPVSGQSEEYAPNGSLLRKSSVKSSQIRINDPAFNESYFDVNMPKGALVHDYTRNAEKPEVYRYGEPRKSYDEIIRSQSKFVAGIAVDKDGSPVPGVAVEVCGHRKPQADGKFSWTFSPSFDVFNAVTDNQGRFAIELEEDGSYNLRFSPENHAAIIAYDVPVGKSDLKVTLPEGGTISGRVVRIEDGQKVPIPSVEVKAEQSDRSGYSHLGFNCDRKTLTDSQGRFQFNHLRTKMRSAETRNSQQWEYWPRAWRISHKNTARTVAFYEGAKIEDVELVVEPDYASPDSLIGKPPHHVVRAKGFGPDQHY